MFLINCYLDNKSTLFEEVCADDFAFSDIMTWYCLLITGILLANLATILSSIQKGYSLNDVKIVGGF